MEKVNRKLEKTGELKTLEKAAIVERSKQSTRPLKEMQKGTGIELREKKVVTRTRAKVVEIRDQGKARL